MDLTSHYLSSNVSTLLRDTSLDSKFSTNTLREFLSREFGHQSTTTGETLIYSRKLGESPSEVAIIINQVINPNKT